MSVSQKLADMNALLDDEFIAIMLGGLTDEYDPMEMTLESANVRLTNDLVKVKLLQDIKYSNSTSLVDRALYSKINRVHNKKKPMVYYKCNKEGYFKSEYVPLTKETIKLLRISQ